VLVLTSILSLASLSLSVGLFRAPSQQRSPIPDLEGTYVGDFMYWGNDLIPSHSDGRVIEIRQEGDAVYYEFKGLLGGTPIPEADRLPNFGALYRTPSGEWEASIRNADITTSTESWRFDEGDILSIFQTPNKTWSGRFVRSSARILL
jgi:hypothetical protein